MRVTTREALAEPVSSMVEEGGDAGGGGVGVEEAGDGGAGSP